MIYRQLECENEHKYRYLAVEDITKPDNLILKSIIEQVKKDIASVLRQYDYSIDQIEDTIESYTPNCIGIQTIHCSSCDYLYVSVIINPQTKIKENHWRSYETERFIKQLMGWK